MSFSVQYNRCEAEALCNCIGDVEPAERGHHREYPVPWRGWASCGPVSPAGGLHAILVILRGNGWVTTQAVCASWSVQIPNVSNGHRALRRESLHAAVAQRISGRRWRGRLAKSGG